MTKNAGLLNELRHGRVNPLSISLRWHHDEFLRRYGAEITVRRIGVPEMKWLLLGLTIALIVVHQDFWNWDKVNVAFGFMPVGLWYHALYCIAAAILMWMLVAFAWPRQLENVEREVPGKSEEPRGH
jgi:hypothetical protein